MSYHVEWSVEARDEALAIALKRTDRAEVVRSLDAIGTILAEEGATAGESREDNFRILIQMPLAVKFSADESNLIVTIAQIWPID